MTMTFDTKIAVVLREDLPVWQKLNVTAFTVSGIAAKVEDVTGERNPVFSLFTEELFATGNDIDNRAAMKAVPTEELRIVGMALRAEKKSVDKVLKGLSLHR